MSDSNVKEVTFRHVSLKGTPYEIGKKEANMIEKYYPKEIEYTFMRNDTIKPALKDRIKKTIKLFDRFCPNINEEINGFADYFGRSAEEITYYSFSYVSKGNCGHFSVLPQKTADNKIYVGRSYEWSDEDDDKRLLTVKADGLYGHMGFSLSSFGRLDGINEKGLCVTMSNGIPLKMSEEEGLCFWTVIRILLDQCKSVDEAIDIIEMIPISAFCNLIITDLNGQAVLVEICNAVKSFERISSSSTNGYLCSTNHYTLPEMKHLVENRMKHSADRYNAIADNLNAETVDKKVLRNILSQKMLNGLTCHHYHDGLGTLWSMLFDVTNIQADICFGSPLANVWHSFDLKSPEGINSYKAVLPNEESTPQTWMKV